MSEDLKAELERLRNEKRGTKEGGFYGYPYEDKRKGSSLDLRYGTLSGDPV
jgi:hypothetical protein